MRIFLNRRLVPSRQATVSVYDHGFLYGDGVYETFRAYGGVIFRADRHLSRLQHSASRIHLTLPHSPSKLRDILYRTLSENKLKEATLRLSISRGVGEPGLDPDLCQHPTIVVIPRAFKGYPESLYRQGLKATIVSTRRFGSESLDPQIKSTNFLNNILARIEAKKAGADEGLMLNREGYLAEGTVSNLFFVKKGSLYTPSLKTGLLNGITRQAVLELAQSVCIKVEENLFFPRDLAKADECFLTNTSMEVMPLTRVGKRRIGDGKPGPITIKLRNAFTALVRLECKIK
jgi:branched-chain amino acid aminotransferase